MENLEFLADVVPKTTTYRQFKQKQQTSASTGVQPQHQEQQANGLANGQSTLDFHAASEGTEEQATNSARDEVEVEAEVDGMEIDDVKSATSIEPPVVDQWKRDVLNESPVAAHSSTAESLEPVEAMEEL